MKIFKRMYIFPHYEVLEETDNACKLKKIIYGFKQSIRASFDKFSTVVARYGLRRSSSDHSIFVRDYSTGIIILTVYVDIVVTKEDHQGIIQLKAYLSSHFHIKNLSLLR